MGGSYPVATMRSDQLEQPQAEPGMQKAEFHPRCAVPATAETGQAPSSAHYARSGHPVGVTEPVLTGGLSKTKIAPGGMAGTSLRDTAAFAKGYFKPRRLHIAGIQETTAACFP